MKVLYARSSSSTGTFVLYNYYPSKVAGVVFVIFFVLCTLAHAYKLCRHKTWYFIPFCIGLIFEALGYLGRSISATESPDWTTGPYILQSLTLLLGPTLLAASIYMTLGRLMRMLHGESYSLIRINWLTKVFVFGDVLSFFTQSGGGGILANASSQSAMDMGENIITGGLIIQIIFFGFFMVVTVVFHRRISRSPTTMSIYVPVPWERFLYVLYAASIFIMIRSVFRVAEYAGGYSGTLQSTEVYIYIFDATLMFILAVLFVIWHPSTVMMPTDQIAIPVTDSDTQNYDTYPMGSRV